MTRIRRGATMADHAAESIQRPLHPQRLIRKHGVQQRTPSTMPMPASQMQHQDDGQLRKAMTTQRAPDVSTCSIRTRPNGIGRQTFGNKIAAQCLLKALIGSGGRRQSILH
eukprot:3408598-Alexandrium_andersonii.AAC.1